MKYLIFILVFTSCYQFEDITPEFQGTYTNDGLILSFNDGQITGSSECNAIYGSYFIVDNDISISIGGTKVFCDEYNFRQLRNIENYELSKDKLILKVDDFELILYKLD